MNGEVKLSSSHVFLGSETVTKIFDRVQFALIIYLKEKNTILISSASSKWFKNMHKGAFQSILKSRNMEGDKTLAIRELLIDNDIDTSDRDLDFEVIEKTKIIKIKL